MNRIGIAVWNFEGNDLSAKVRMFAEMGYTAVSLNGLLLDTLSRDALTDAGKVAQDYDLLITMHGGIEKDLPLGEDTPYIRAERVLEWHEQCGRIVATSYDVPNMVLPDGTKRKDPAKIMSVFARILDLFQGSGVRVMMEDCPLNDEIAREFGDLAERYPHLGVLIDLGHMNLRIPEQTPAAVEAYLKAIPMEIVELHIHSNDGLKDQHAPPYVPNADLATAAKVLREIGFSGISTIEIAPSWCGLSKEDIIPACRKSLEYWRALVPQE